MVASVRDGAREREREMRMRNERGREEVKDRQMMVEERERERWAEAERKIFKKRRDWQGEKTRSGKRQRQIWRWVNQILNMTKCVAATLPRSPPPRHVDTQNLLPTKKNVPHHFPSLIHHHSPHKGGVKIAAAGWLALLSGWIRMHGDECVSQRRWHPRPWSHNVTSSGDPALMSFAYSFTYS